MADLRPVYVAGDGDVKGPASASNNFLPLFADTTGKLLKSSGTGVTAQGLAILDDNTPAEQRNTIGLDQVNNTSDINKPVSTAQQTALNLKQDKLNYTPVQQGGGIGQSTNKVYIGWNNTGKLKVTVDATDLGNVIFDSNTATESVVGVSRFATQTEVSNSAATNVAVAPATLGVLLTNYVKHATTTVAGIARIATQAEVYNAFAPDLIVTPSTFGAALTGYFSANALGSSQTWQDLTSNRSANTTYTNSAGRPIAISIYTTIATNWVASITVSGVVVASNTTNNMTSGGIGTLSAIIPAGASYSFAVSATSISKWMELR